MTERIVLSWTLMAAAAAALAYASVGPAYNHDLSPTVAGGMAVLGAFLLAMGYLIGVLARSGPRQRSRRGDLAEGLTERTARALVAGVVTSAWFLLFYWGMDFPYDLSERRIDEIAQQRGWPLFSPDPALVVEGKPIFLLLVPEFLLTGAVIGTLIGHFLPLWRRLWSGAMRGVTSSPIAQSVWFSYPLFGIICGFSLGAIFNVFIFAKPDGRPFFRLLTAVSAASVSVVCYVILEARRRRKTIVPEAIYDLVSVAIGAFAIAAVVFMADQAFHLSERAYLHFYSAWDTRFNQLRVTPTVVAIAGAYGAVLGTVIMLVVAGYSFVRSVHSGSGTLDPAE